MLTKISVRDKLVFLPTNRYTGQGARQKLTVKLH